MISRKMMILLSVLTASAVFNVGLSWWPEDSPPSLIPEDISAPVAQAAGKDGGATSMTTGADSRKDEAAMVELAEASAYSNTGSSKPSQEELETYSNLRAIKEKLDERSKTLDERQESIVKAEADIAKRIDELESLRTQIQSRLDQEDSIKTKKIKRLTAVYSSMKPEKAALVITRLELDTIIKMFSRMDEKKVGKILSFLPPENAVKITQALSRQVADL
ncbi:MAG: MotE family protein [Mariprofundaceae bacterium]